ncbi:RagB/SusD family nutrient uptake outer membrane protein [Pontixanthobacter gangjinensis]|uniref:RagB/SusD family nutrient uptake outer membrane protein n=1 Tax=Christiangramia aestuarii TaxID=1028746 RepID=A0A7M3SWL0_9FLAO|nr:RagB/SusD family nutrient uptake outer membrane protein [Christiangramia aestuarii]MUP40991.1 RagB/SusD family nutrient uptake outer membrane protein [Christiangramia aestuarii]
MKRINKILAITLLLGLSVGCSDVLEVELDDEIRSTEAINDAISLQSAVTGLYSVAQSGTYYGGEFIMAQDLTGGIADATGFRERFAQLDNAQVPASSIYLESAWVDAYALVNSSNLILEKIEELQLDDPESMGAAHFFRALGLFDALRQFGEYRNMSSEFGVPVFTEYVDNSTALGIGRSSVAESYNQIISDLETAESLMEYTGERFLVSKATAEALLARVHLYAGNYEEAEAYATLVLDNPDYRLNDDYNEIYENEGSDEAIWELQFTETDGNNLTEYFSVSPPEVSASYEDFYADIAADDDPRGDLYYDDGRVVFVDKYGVNDATVDGNTIMFRLSEIYLIRAEARARQGNLDLALEDLNMVRTRSLPSMPIEAEDVADFESFVDVLLEERARELAFEGHRWFDIVRLGRAEEVLGIESFRTVYPIPQREITISGGTLVQNPGY